MSSNWQPISEKLIQLSSQLELFSIRQLLRFIMSIRITDVYMFAFSNWNSFNFTMPWVLLLLFSGIDSHSIFQVHIYEGLPTLSSHGVDNHPFTRV